MSILVVQSAEGATSASLTGVSPSNSLIVLATDNGPGTGQTMSGGGGSWSLVCTPNSGNNYNPSILVSPTTTGGSVTVTGGAITPFGAFQSVTLLEVSGLGASDSVPTGTSGSGATVTGPTVSPSASGELVVAILDQNGYSFSGGPGTNPGPSGWTGLPVALLQSTAAAYIITGSPVTPVWTATGTTGVWSVAACSFQAAAVVLPPGPPIAANIAGPNGALFHHPPKKGWHQRSSGLLLKAA